MELEEKLDGIISMMEEINQLLARKVEEKEKVTSKEKPSRVMNSHVHFMISTEEKQKLMDKAKAEGIDFSEWCRRKLKESDQLDRIENKLDTLKIE